VSGNEPMALNDSGGAGYSEITSPMDEKTGNFINGSGSSGGYFSDIRSPTDTGVSQSQLEAFQQNQNQKQTQEQGTQSMDQLNSMRAQDNNQFANFQ